MLVRKGKDPDGAGRKGRDARSSPFCSLRRQGSFTGLSRESISLVANCKSVAVLPFDNISDSKENFCFSDGLTSEVIFQLSKVVDLRVISRQSVLRYRDVPIEHQKSLSQIGRD